VSIFFVYRGVDTICSSVLTELSVYTLNVYLFAAWCVTARLFVTATGSFACYVEYHWPIVIWSKFRCIFFRIFEHL